MTEGKRKTIILSTALINNFEAIDLELADAEGKYGERISGYRKVRITADEADRIRDQRRDAELEKGAVHG